MLNLSTQVQSTFMDFGALLPTALLALSSKEQGQVPLLVAFSSGKLALYQVNQTNGGLYPSHITFTSISREMAVNYLISNDQGHVAASYLPTGSADGYPITGFYLEDNSTEYLKLLSKSKKMQKEWWKKITTMRWKQAYHLGTCISSLERNAERCQVAHQGYLQTLSVGSTSLRKKGRLSLLPPDLLGKKLSQIPNKGRMVSLSDPIFHKHNIVYIFKEPYSNVLSLNSYDMEKGILSESFEGCQKGGKHAPHPDTLYPCKGGYILFSKTRTVQNLEVNKGVLFTQNLDCEELSGSRRSKFLPISKQQCVSVDLLKREGNVHLLNITPSKVTSLTTCERSRFTMDTFLLGSLIVTMNASRRFSLYCLQ